MLSPRSGLARRSSFLARSSRIKIGSRADFCLPTGFLEIAPVRSSSINWPVIRWFMSRETVVSPCKSSGYSRTPQTTSCLRRASLESDHHAGTLSANGRFSLGYRRPYGRGEF
jgi:hypothetical protein